MFMGTSGSVAKTTYTNANYTAAVDEQMSATCEKAKKQGVMLITVSLDLVETKADEKKAIEALKKCSSDSRFRKDASGKPAKLYWNATGASLAEKFKEIADELSNLRIVG